MLIFTKKQTCRHKTSFNSLLSMPKSSVCTIGVLRLVVLLFGLVSLWFSAIWEFLLGVTNVLSAVLVAFVLG